MKRTTEGEGTWNKAVVAVALYSVIYAVSGIWLGHRVFGPDYGHFDYPVFSFCGRHLSSLVGAAGFEGTYTEALVKALIAGDRSDISPQIREIFRESGASHLLALSGLHLGILYMIVSKTLSVLGSAPGARAVRCVCMTSAAFFYMSITGATPSITRAFLFILIRETAAVTRRDATALNVFCLALSIQLLASPGCIVMPGFQLSYLAICGIFLVHPHLAALYPEDGRRGWRNPMRKIWEMMSMSISCQVFTAGIVWWHFHTFPKYFILTNVISLPLTTIIVPLSLLAVIAASAGICPAILTHAVDRLCDVLVFVLKTISDM